MSRETMRWWGWGIDKDEMDPKDRPYLWPWVYSIIPYKERSIKPIARELIKLPPSNINQTFVNQLQQRLRPDQIAFDEEARLCHSYGKSVRDLLRIRKGIISASPDIVIYPESHNDVEAIVQLALTHDVCLIPFGGGSNIVGAVEPRDSKKRMVASLHMGTMERLLELDPKSMTATLEAGVLGPALESKLNALGYSLGHVPDSFEYSSLGGWIATRSAGQQSDAYGRIEDMVVSLKMVTPAGTLITKNVPACSIGPDLNAFGIGSEGTLGVITEATMRVHPLPQTKEYVGYLFPTFADGIEAVHQLVHGSYRPSMIRLLDQGDVDLAGHMGHKIGLFKRLKQFLQKKIVTKMLGVEIPCLLVLGFEGEKEKVQHSNKYCNAICKKNKGIFAGASVGKKWRNSRFDLPYVRDMCLNRGLTVDVAETSTTWTNILPLYHQVINAIKTSMAQTGHPGWVGCHVSHCYETGASLYFSYACQQEEGREFEQYNYIKGSATEVIIKNGGALSHHHAVGIEHQPWLIDEIGATGLKFLQGMKTTCDPSDIFNPGKLMEEASVTQSATTTIPRQELYTGWKKDE